MRPLKPFGNIAFVVVLAAMTIGCSDYYEWRIDRLYAECANQDLTAAAVDDCLKRTAQLETAYGSPRLAALRQRLEAYVSAQMAREIESNTPVDPTLGAGSDILGGATVADEYSIYPDYGEPLSDTGLVDTGDVGIDFDDFPFAPESDSIPVSEPQEPLEPDR
jgi:hypothetical protein